MVWIETPTNPTLKLVDIKAVCEIAKRKNPKIVTIVDNTFASSFFQVRKKNLIFKIFLLKLINNLKNPLELGADIAMHSLTKYMNGHSDVVMGAIMLNDEELYTRMKYLQNACGAVPSPFDCYLANRGLKTLALRMRQHQENGLKIAKALVNNPRIEKVIYPGLESHPQHELYKKQMKGFGGMISVYIKGGIEESFVFLKSLNVYLLFF